LPFVTRKTRRAKDKTYFVPDKLQNVKDKTRFASNKSQNVEDKAHFVEDKTRSVEAETQNVENKEHFVEDKTLFVEAEARSVEDKTRFVEAETPFETVPIFMNSLKHHEEVVRRDLELLDYPRRDWTVPRVTSRGQNVLDCLIIGGGQGGLAVAAALGRERVQTILVVDASPAGNEGPWRTFGRMITLRTPKYLTGPDGGVPSLTIRAWYEAQFGEDSWENLTQFPKEMWADYLFWLRQVLELPVQNETRAGAIEWLESEKCFAIPLQEKGSERLVFARTVVLATGIEGSGAWHTPPQVKDALPEHLYAHTHTEIGFPDLHGKRVAILGAGACAFDNSAVALEHGAKSVDLFFRRRELVRVNPYRWGEFTGFLKHHADLPDADKWKFILQLVKMGQLPPTTTYQRATAFENFHIHPASPLSDLKSQGEVVHLETPQGHFEADFLIVGTGFQTDLGVRPELPHLLPHIALWRDRFTPPEHQQSEDLLRHPYLGPNFEFTEKVAGTAPHLSAVFNYTFGCLLSLGFGGASISGMKYSLPRVVAGVTKRLYLEDKDQFFESLLAYDTPEF
jgi:cation diffusion facilitator CzcD-associated flavoprotein CzcO